LQRRTSKDIAAMRDTVAAKCEQIGHRAPFVVNYDAFTLGPDLESEYVETVRAMEEKYYAQVSRFTTSAFMHKKLGQLLTRSVRPHVFESRSEARAFHDMGG
jgi:propionate CoA-transferase